MCKILQLGSSSVGHLPSLLVPRLGCFVLRSHYLDFVQYKYHLGRNNPKSEEACLHYWTKRDKIHKIKYTNHDKSKASKKMDIPQYPLPHLLRGSTQASRFQRMSRHPSPCLLHFPSGLVHFMCGQRRDRSPHTGTVTGHSVACVSMDELRMKSAAAAIRHDVLVYM